MAQRVLNWLQDFGVDMGWRLKNVGLARIGLWLVHTCHRTNGISGASHAHLR